MENYPTWRALSYEFWACAHAHWAWMAFFLAIFVLTMMATLMDIDELRARVSILERRP